MFPVRLRKKVTAPMYARTARFIAVLSCIAPFACEKQSSSNTDAPHHHPLAIEVVGFAGCPHTVDMLERVRAAATGLGIHEQVAYVDQDQLDPTDSRRNWPAPTVLVNGQDLFGLPTPRSHAPGCRIYENGMPATDEVQSMLAKHFH